MNYIPTTPPVPPQPRSVSPVRAPPPLPSSRAPAADEYEMMEDFATPMRHASPAASEDFATPIRHFTPPAPLIDPTTGPAAPGSIRDLVPARPSAPTGHWDGGQHQNGQHQSGPLQTGPIQPLPMPPPSNRGGPTRMGPTSQQGMQASSSGRMRQLTPIDTPQYSSQNAPVSGNQITGPHVPIRPPSTGSYPNHSGVPSSARRPSAEDGLPLGYVVASAFFLAIALVGFGLYLAFEVF